MDRLLVAAVVGFALAQLGTLLTTLYLHRALAHRAVTLAPRVAAVFRVLVWVTTGIRPRQWVAVHRKHHAFTDVEGDPHSPLLLGFAKVQLANAALYRRVAKDPAVLARYARDLPADRWDRALFDHALVGLAVGIAFLCLTLGLATGLLAAGIHAFAYLALNAAVNAVGHRFGRQPHPNTARNSQWLAWLTAGEGLHNNHHAMPTSARLGLRRGEVDPGWWALRLFQRFGWATVRLDRERVLERLAG